ncbi:hypothetical protein CW696_00240 [ANME-2 cluster archaeon]|nr:MAG: hypothetical protein CW696_00240 [ANME-2 cluster archaeon]
MMVYLFSAREYADDAPCLDDSKIKRGEGICISAQNRVGLCTSLVYTLAAYMQINDPGAG